jgi:hypothetical protein
MSENRLAKPMPATPGVSHREDGSFGICCPFRGSAGIIHLRISLSWAAESRIRAWEDSARRLLSFYHERHVPQKWRRFEKKGKGKRQMPPVKGGAA